MAAVFLLPGQYRISKAPAVLETLVGSCVSVCLYNKKTGHAAMNHFLQDQPRYAGDDDIGKYGCSATEHIITSLMERDPDPHNYHAQIFGGANVIKTNCTEGNIGQKNIDMAKKILTEHHIRIIHEEVGGTRGRRIRFDTAINSIFCRFAGDIKKNPANTRT